MCVYSCVSVCVPVCVHAHVCLIFGRCVCVCARDAVNQTCFGARMRTLTYTCTHPRTHAHMHTSTHACVRTSTHRCSYICMRMHAHAVRMRARAHRQAWTHAHACALASFTGAPGGSGGRDAYSGTMHACLGQIQLMLNIDIGYGRRQVAGATLSTVPRRTCSIKAM